ncbi:MAG: hypothetical protein U0822_08735 [Anaerolineae bacterium]
MKKPRLEDFDPNTTPHLGSPMDDLPVIQPPAPPTVQPSPSPSPNPNLSGHQAIFSAAAPSDPVAVQVPPTESPMPDRPSAPPDVRPYARTLVRRAITRYAFEFFQDQIESLREFGLDEKSRGEKGSMSQMVREALDAYISRRRNRDE